MPRPDADPDAPDAAVGGGPMVDVAAGPFDRGCDPLLGNDCRADTKPHRTITLSAFRIDAHEVTQGEYQLCVAAGTCRPPAARFEPVARAEFPVTDVSYTDAVAYCASVQKRLPSEAEWEKAARGTDSRTFPWGATRPDCHRVGFDHCHEEPDRVASHTDDASPFGATEMAGNVTEWVADYYSSTYYDSAPDHDPTGPSSGEKRIVRGGDWESVEEFLRTFDRDPWPPSTTKSFIGFRCAR